MSLDAMFKRANAALHAGKWADAERSYKSLTRLKPAWAHHNLGVVYTATGRFAEAETAYRKALIADPLSNATKHSLSMLLLGDGRYAEAWPLYEARRGVAGLNIPNPRVSFPEWRGESLAGKHLLVIREQGLGDQIMLARFIPELMRRAARVTYLCDPPLTSLFVENGIEAIAAQPGAHFPEADCWVLAFSIPLRLGVTLETLSGAPYLKAAVRSGRGGGVGIKARGGTAHTNDRHRSLTPKAAELLEAMGLNLDPMVTGAADMLATAETIAGLDLVISVDTSVAHLAAAMGKPTLVLLSAVETDWRWLRGRSDSPWYNSVRLHRQEVPGKWDQILRKLQADSVTEVG